MGCCVDVRRRLAAGLLGAVLLPGLAAAGTPRPPSLQIVKATVDRAAHTVDLRLRICFSAGPRALIAVTERRSLHGVEKASNHWVPRAVEPTRIYPFSCNDHWRVNWLLKPRLSGPGTYTVSLRVRDAYGRWTPGVTLSVTSA